MKDNERELLLLKRKLDIYIRQHSESKSFLLSVEEETSILKDRLRLIEEQIDPMTEQFEKSSKKINEYADKVEKMEKKMGKENLIHKIRIQLARLERSKIPQ